MLAAHRSPRPIEPDSLRAHLQEHGGLTYDPRTGASPTTGIAVCPDHRRSRALPWPGANDGALRRWLEHLQRELRPGRLLGAWLDPASPHVWIEAVVVLPSHAHTHAMQVAARAGQRAVYDIDAGQVVPVTAER